MADSPSSLQMLLKQLGIDGSDLENRNYAVIETIRVLISIFPMAFVFMKDGYMYIEMNNAFSTLFDISHESNLLELDLALASYGDIHSLMRDIAAGRQELHSRLFYFERIDRSMYLAIDAMSVKKDSQHLGTFFMMREIPNFIQLETDVLNVDRLTTIGKVASGIAHEIRNPMASIRGFMQLLGEEFKSKGWEREKSYADLILTEIDRVNGLVNQLLLLSKPMDIEHKVYDVNTMVGDVGRLHEVDANMSHVQIRYQFEEVPNVKLDLNMFKQVMTNLIRNALEAMEEGGELTLATSYDAAKNHVKINVTDTGPGIPAYLLDRIFDAFFTTKAKGTGLGLAICQRIIHEFGGHIRVISKGYGTTFSITLPVSSKE